MSPAWQSAISALSLGSPLGNVVSTNNRPMEIQPYQTLTLSGMVRKSDNECIAITEPSESGCKGLGVCPRVVRVARVHVSVFNISAKTIKIAPKSVLCELQEAKVLRNWSPDSGCKTEITSKTGPPQKEKDDVITELKLDLSHLEPEM
ncbi:hypothetical protein DPMN_027050 [Dreissena polymorpha]|uniref:Uncharacterized protein n=1 Tax=Dreissena polymorpha TaxID=45954 RepID=A0A9D4LSS7_DREPO|nr:hypothetical protein DPMN_027050 [Dreissena polymorpha]